MPNLHNKWIKQTKPGISDKIIPEFMFAKGSVSVGATASALDSAGAGHKAVVDRSVQSKAPGP